MAEKPATMNACKSRVTSLDYDEVYKLHMLRLHPTQIARKMNCAQSSVTYAIARMREAYGEEVVPYLDGFRRPKTAKPSSKSEQKPKPKPKLEPKPEPKRTASIKQPCFRYEVPETWAGAFRLLANHLRKSGDAEGWELAKRIAKDKKMSL